MTNTHASPSKWAAAFITCHHPGITRQLERAFERKAILVWTQQAGLQVPEWLDSLCMRPFFRVLLRCFVLIKAFNGFACFKAEMCCPSSTDTYMWIGWDWLKWRLIKPQRQWIRQKGTTSNGWEQQRTTGNLGIKYLGNHIVVAIGTLLILKLYIFVNYKHDVVLLFLFCNFSM